MLRTKEITRGGIGEISKFIRENWGNKETVWRFISKKNRIRLESFRKRIVTTESLIQEWDFREGKSWVTE